MATRDEGTVEVELTGEQQGLVLALWTHAAAGVLETLRAGGYRATEEQLHRVVGTLDARAFTEAVLVLENASVSDAELVEAARLRGARAVVAALGPAPMAH